jgi:hypothetical protein
MHLSFTFSTPSSLRQYGYARFNLEEKAQYGFGQLVVSGVYGGPQGV